MTDMRNAADEEQVRESGNAHQRRRRRELNDLRFLLATEQGRRFVWRMLEHCKVFESIWHASALIHFNSGRQDVGHFILGEVTEANEDALLQMMKEAKQGELKNV